MKYTFDYIVEPQMVDSTLTARLAAVETMLLNSAGKAADQLGIGVEDLLKDNYAWILARIAFELDYRPKLGSVITVETWIDHAEMSFSIRNFRILSDNKQVGLGKSIWTVLNLQTRRSVNLMTEERFSILSTNIDNGMSMPENLMTVNSDPVYIYKTVYSDIDFEDLIGKISFYDMMRFLLFEQVPWRKK